MNNSNKTLLQILVEELPTLGGWPEGVAEICQDYDHELKFLGEDRPRYHSGIFTKQLCAGHRVIYTDHYAEKVTRDQYEAALAASKEPLKFSGDDGWILWQGGECPVDSDAIVEVKYRKPNPYQFNNDRAGDFTWSHDGFDGDIIAYRLQQPHEVKTAGIDVQRDAVKSNDAQLEADLNDCIGQPQSNDDARDEILYELANFAATTKTSLDIGVATEIAIWLSGKGYRKQ